jgi:hypothetical protein
MYLSLPGNRRTNTRLIGLVGLGLVLLVAVPAHAAGSAGTAVIPTNRPNTFAFRAPSPGFDPTTASTADLQRYGFPLPPDRARAPKAYESWVTVMHHADHEVLPTFIPHPDVKHATSQNWSGTVYTVQNRSCFPPICFLPTSPYAVWGMWTVPDVSVSTQTSYSSAWVGLDGMGNKQVEQMGTEQRASRWCFLRCFTATTYYAWFELFPDSEQMIQGLSINPGDMMYADVEYENSSNQMFFFIEDITTGQYVPFVTSATHGCGCVSAEWIMERPAINGNLPALADFGNVQFNYAYFSAVTPGLGTSPYPATATGSFTVNMVNTSGTMLAYGYTPEADQVDSEWVNYS